MFPSIFPAEGGRDTFLPLHAVSLCEKAPSWRCYNVTSPFAGPFFKPPKSPHPPSSGLLLSSWDQFLAPYPSNRTPSRQLPDTILAPMSTDIPKAWLFGASILPLVPLVPLRKHLTLSLRSPYGTLRICYKPGVSSTLGHFQWLPWRPLHRA